MCCMVELRRLLPPPPRETLAEWRLEDAVVVEVLIQWEPMESNTKTYKSYIYIMFAYIIYIYMFAYQSYPFTFSWISFCCCDACDACTNCCCCFFALLQFLFVIFCLVVFKLINYAFWWWWWWWLLVLGCWTMSMGHCLCFVFMRSCCTWSVVLFPCLSDCIVRCLVY